MMNKEINEQIWKGKEKEGFDHHYDYYKDEAKTYKSNVENVKDEIDKVIESTKNSIQGRQTGLENLETILVQLENDIEKARKERSEEHTSELQSRGHLVCRLLLEKKKKHEQQGSARRQKDGRIHYRRDITCRFRHVSK